MKLIQPHKEDPEELKFDRKTDIEFYMAIGSDARYGDYNAYVEDFVDRNLHFYLRQFVKEDIQCIANDAAESFLYKIAMAMSQFANDPMIGARELKQEERKAIVQCTKYLPEFEGNQYTIFNLNSRIIMRRCEEKAKLLNELTKDMLEMIAKNSTSS